MFDKLFCKAQSIARHRNAPFAQEREQFLQKCAVQGYALNTLRQLAGELLVIIRSLRIPTKVVTLKQICASADQWTSQRLSTGKARHGKGSFDRFRRTAVQWARFLNQLHQPSKPEPFPGLLEEYVRWMERERGLSPRTIQLQGRAIRQFLLWYSQQGKAFTEIMIKDVDAFLATHGASVWGRGTVANRASILRMFFRHLASRGLCSPSIGMAILRPRVYSQEAIAMGPSWEEVEKLLASLDGDRPADIRDRAIVMLFAIYGLRSGDVARLRLEDIDWERNQLWVKCTKRRQPQGFPLISSVGNAVIRYLREVRPQDVGQREVFLRLKAPYQPLSRGGLFHTVADRMAALGIRPPHRGPHSLRHACATHLLAQHFSLKEIGDLLGHRRPSTTQVYAKVDMPHLYEVAAFDLGGVL